MFVDKSLFLTDNSAMGKTVNTPITDGFRQAVEKYLKNGGTLGGLAKETGLDVGSVHRWWHEKSDVRTSTLDAIAAVLKLTVKNR